MMSTYDIKQLNSCIKFRISTRVLSPKSTVRFSFVSVQAINLLRIFTCLIQSFNGRNSAGVKHPEMAVVTGTNTGLTWKSYMVSDNISAENWDKYSINESSKSQLTIENMTWRFSLKGNFEKRGTRFIDLKLTIRGRQHLWFDNHSFLSSNLFQSAE